MRSMYVVVVGAGEVGSTIAANLSENHEVAVVELDPELVDTLTYEMDVLPVQGDGTDISTLREADIERADMLVASTDNDETNIVTCATAAILGDIFTVARVKRRQYLETWETHERAFDVDFMVCTDLLTAENVVQTIGLPAARDVDTFAGGTVRMAEFEIPAGSPVADSTVSEVDRFDNLTFAGVVRDGAVEIPRGETVLRAGDGLVVIGTPKSVEAFGGDIAPQEGGPTDVVILGGSPIGFETARLLEERGFKPRLIERDEDRARQCAEKLPGTTVMQAEATDSEFLGTENVGDADAVVAALESEERNLLGSLLAKRAGAKRSISVVESGEYVQVFEAVGVDVAVNPRTIVAEEITRFTRERHTENIALIEGDRAEVIEIEIDEESVLVGRPIREAVEDLPDGVVVGAITRAGGFVTPRGDTVVEVGDHVVVLAREEVAEETVAAL